MPGPARSPSSQKGVQPPRPANAWILYRSDKSKTLNRQAQSDMSKAIATMWKTESREVREHYEKKAEDAKAEHARKYPQYRFQPVKKEQRRANKIASKAIGQIPEPQSSQPPTSHATSASSVPGQARSYANPLLLNLSLPGQPDPRRYGPNGPTPPMSAASSPSGSIVELPSVSRVDTFITAATHPSFYPQTPASTIDSPLIPADQGQQMDSFDNGAFSAALVPQWKAPSEDQPESLLFEGGQPWDGMSMSYPSVQQHDLLQFDLSEMAMQNWTGDQSEFAQLLGGDSTASIFQLDNFDPQLLLENPTGPLEVTMAPMAFNVLGQPIPNLSQLSYYGQDSHSPILDSSFGNEISPLFTTEQPTPAYTDEASPYPADKFFDYDYGAAQGMSHSPTAESSRSYVPPAGAANASARRVGGTWRPSPVAVSPIDQTPAWDVRA